VSSGHRDYDYLEWIARHTSHIPKRGTHLVHYYGAYSNAHRGVARRREIFLAVPPEDEPPDPPRPDSAWLAARRKSWARLIRRVYEVDPLLCPCGERMRVVGFIAQAPVLSPPASCLPATLGHPWPSSSRSLPTSGGAKAPETPRPVAAAFRRLLPRPVPGLRSTVRRPGPESLLPFPLDVRRARGFRVAPHPIVRILMAKGCRMRQCAGERG
jgi:hypothetical protein